MVRAEASAVVVIIIVIVIIIVVVIIIIIIVVVVIVIVVIVIVVDAVGDVGDHVEDGEDQREERHLWDAGRGGVGWRRAPLAAVAATTHGKVHHGPSRVGAAAVTWARISGLVGAELNLILTPHVRQLGQMRLQQLGEKLLDPLTWWAARESSCAALTVVHVTAAAAAAAVADGTAAAAVADGAAAAAAVIADAAADSWCGHASSWSLRANSARLRDVWYKVAIHLRKRTEALWLP